MGSREKMIIRELFLDLWKKILLLVPVVAP